VDTVHYVPRVHELAWPSPTEPQVLRTRWTDLCRRAAVDGAGAGDSWDRLVHGYSSPTRHHHTLEHVGEVLALLDALGGTDGPSVSLELAAWMHDVVYDPQRSDNEDASATWTRTRLLDVGFDRSTLDHAAELILTTAEHDPSLDDPDAQLLSDADLAILGAPPERYERYATAVRREYAHLDDAAWRRGRGDVLRALLDRPVLYHHAGLLRWEPRARRNLSGELAGLGRS
jgi:predicted metal-dependent HD superfamily phosphohydrolase